MSDLYPVSIEFENIYCYAGKHSVDLVPSCYAVIAQAEDNPSRSNWLGKSTFLMLFAYALYGWHTKRTDDEIVTHGQTSSRVVVRLNDGTSIDRSKMVGKSTQLKVTIGDSDRVLTQDAAQDALERHLVMSKDQFFLVFFYRQKKIDQLVTAGGAGRSEIIDGWLAEEIEPYQRLGEALVSRKAGNAKLLAEAVYEITKHEEQISALAKQYETSPEMLVARLVDLIEEGKRKVDQETRDESALRDRYTELYSRRKAFEAKAHEASRYDEVVSEGVSTKQALESLPSATRDEIVASHAHVTSLRATRDEAAKRVGSLKVIKATTTCPVVDKPCPSVEWLKAQASDSKVMSDQRAKVDELSREIDEARVRCEKLDRAARERERLETRLVALRVEAERLGEIVDEVELTEVEPCEDLGARLYEIEKRKSALSLAVSIAATNLTKANQALACLEVARKKHSDVKVEEDLLREAGQVLTKAQQAVKETVLANIEQLANKMLESADIPLRVEFSWSQETKGLAKVCDCGVAFPDSKRVKSCPACKAPRGNATTHKLQIELSNTSGAAEDLGGLSLGIGAALWLRARRGIRWSCAFIDEPFGALDFHNKDALGTHVLGMLSQSFSSAFVVAHDRSILSSMPSRVEIVSGPNGSRIRRV